ncbi:MAG: thiamine phosphate synthase [Gemmatimonadales bacterium]
MRPLPRLLALTTDALCRSPDFGVRAAAIAATGPAVGIVVRAPGSTAAQHAAFAERVAALCRPPEASLLVHARPDLARAVAAQGVVQRRTDLSPGDARAVAGTAWIGASVHSADEAREAVDDGADFLLAGNVWETASHPGRPAKGLGWLEGITAAGRPVFAIGGVTADRAAEARAAGAWGVAAISAAWEAADPASAAAALVAPWTESS